MENREEEEVARRWKAIQMQEQEDREQEHQNRDRDQVVLGNRLALLTNSEFATSGSQASGSGMGVGSEAELGSVEEIIEDDNIVTMNGKRRRVDNNIKHPPFQSATIGDHGSRQGGSGAKNAVAVGTGGVGAGRKRKGRGEK